MAILYAWIVTEDTTAEQPNESSVGAIGPRGAPPEFVRRLRAGEGREFRMLDDDREHYYSGRIIVEIDGAPAEGTETDFAPLDDFGTPMAGATAIQYRATAGAWADL